MNKAKDIIEKLQLQPHPEGGYFRETYRSAGVITEENLGESYQGSRNYCTCIYFLLTSDNFSAFHRINQDEIWHFYDGAPILLHLIAPNGRYSSITIGNALEKAQVPQFIVPGGHWFAAEVPTENTFSLVGCTVSPGFDFQDFDLPMRQMLVEKFPQHKAIITKLTHA
ncbi:cupin domain-containing protein [Sungkyunkwania multivorans]|uniref:Cupin domain-containing protein n=1 Tax=Sungkyunkwania multivorans TaxID=1173618 RepID=A0ABW3D0A1_9FLAO